MYKKEQIGLFIIINIVLLGLIVYASTSLTISFFGSIGTEDIKTSNLILGIVNDSCKIFLPLCVGVALFKQKYIHATVLIIICIGTMYLSYMASQGLDLNISNGHLLNSSNKKEIVSIKNENSEAKTKLEDEKNTLIIPLQKQMKALPSNYITRKKQLQNDINKITDKYNKRISVYEGEISTFNNQIINYKVNDELTTQGYHALAKSTGFTVDTITKYKNIFLEVLAIVLSLNLGLLLGESNIKLYKKRSENNESNNNNGDSDNNSNNSKHNRTNKIDELEVKRYRNEMERTHKKGISLGYKTLAKRVGLKDTGSIMHNYLVANGIVKVVNNETRILKYMNEGA